MQALSFKPASARGELWVIGATTDDEYRQYIAQMPPGTALPTYLRLSPHCRSPWRSCRVSGEGMRNTTALPSQTMP